jgi:ribosomal protein S18 acetylase RimI-like enzyme
VSADLEVERLLRGMVIRRVRGRDFGQLFELIGSAFRRESVITGLSVERLSRVAKLYWLFEVVVPIFDLFGRDFETILVAVSGDKLIGEIHLSSHGRRIWSLDSSAVDVMFRRRGVYKRLLNEALEYISKRGGKRVVTSLWTDNIAPVKMTNRLGFVIFETDVLMRLELDRVPVVTSVEGASVREFGSADKERVYEICCSVDPAKMRVFKRTPDDFLDSFLSRLNGWLTWSCSKKWILEVDGEAIGYSHVVFTPPQRAGKIESFCVLPVEGFERLAEFFLGRILGFLALKGVRKVTVSLNREWERTIRVFEGFGFKSVAFVYEMVKELD